MYMREGEREGIKEFGEIVDVGTAGSTVGVREWVKYRLRDNGVCRYGRKGGNYRFGDNGACLGGNLFQEGLRKLVQIIYGIENTCWSNKLN